VLCSNFSDLLCGFASLREIFFLAKAQRRKEIPSTFTLRKVIPPNQMAEQALTQFGY